MIPPDEPTPERHGVDPLPYHREVAAILAQENPESFRALTPGSGSGGSEVDQALLRATYRLEPASHPDVHAAVGRAAAALGVSVPVAVYADEGRQGANAELVFVPDRAVLLFTGPTLELLDPDELCAVAGHELAHHVLWTTEGGRFLAATRLLDAAESDARTPSEYLETARRYRLATELYADRAALACIGEVSPAITGLLKVTTGLRQVDAESYLRQAAEVDLTKGSGGLTHPETVLRAWALDQWAGQAGRGEDADTVDTRIADAFAPSWDLETLDLLGQDRLLTLTRALVRATVSVPELHSPGVLELAEAYGVDVPPAKVEPSGLVPAAASKPTRAYLASVLADLATADTDSGQESLAQTLVVARRAELEPDFLRFVVSELGLGDRDRVRLLERADALGGAR